MIMEKHIKPTVIVITSEYPYGDGETFLENEIPFLSKSFNIIIVPAKLHNNKRITPKNIIIRDDFAELQMRRSKIEKFFSALFVALKFIYEFRYAPLNFAAYRSILAYCSMYATYKIWFDSSLHHETLNKPLIIYSYWLNAGAFAATYFKQRLYNCALFISRAHRFDLYENSPEKKIHYIPFRKYILRNIDTVYCASNDGAKYLQKKYNRYKNKIDVSMLGVQKQDIVTSISNNDCFHIVSCSNLVKVKRVDRIIMVLKKIYELGTERKILWTHIGDKGNLKESLFFFAKQQLSKTNILFQCTGTLTNHKVLEFYKSTPVDLFINLSSSEGLPVSIMEALSFGIPVIATNTGGVGELIDDSVGMLINKDISISSIANCIINFMKKDKKIKLKIRRGAFKRWQEKVNASKNYIDFSRQLNKKALEHFKRTGNSE